MIQHIFRTGMSAFAIFLVLLATTGIHVHADHDDQGHHHTLADHHHHGDAGDLDHDPAPIGGADDGTDTEGQDGTLFHAHGGLSDLASVQVMLPLRADHYAKAAKYRTSLNAVPDHPARDIESPPNKRVL